MHTHIHSTPQNSLIYGPFHTSWIDVSFDFLVFGGFSAVLFPNKYTVCGSGVYVSEQGDAHFHVF